MSLNKRKVKSKISEEPKDPTHYVYYTDDDAFDDASQSVFFQETQAHSPNSNGDEHDEKNQIQD